MRAWGRDGKPVFSLMRLPAITPPAKGRMGFCFLNNIAIAVLEAAATGSKRVAVFDFDVHHGNGTEDILLDHPRHGLFFCASIFPPIPALARLIAGTTVSTIPVAPATPREAYRVVPQPRPWTA